MTETMRQTSEFFGRSSAEAADGAQAAAQIGTVRQDATPPLAAQTAQTSEPAAMFSGPGPILWAGVGTVLFVMLIVFILLLRGRAGAAARQPKDADRHFFEPAGENAEITFDDLQGENTRVKSSVGRPRSRPEEVEAEVIVERNPAVRALDPYRETQTQPESAPKGGRFSGIFARAPATEKKGESDRREKAVSNTPPIESSEGEDATREMRRRQELEESRRRFDEEHLRRNAEREAEFERRKLAAARAEHDRADDNRSASARASLDQGVDALRRDLAVELDRRFSGLETRLISLAGDARRIEDVERATHDMRRDLALELDRRFESLQRELAHHAADAQRDAGSIQQHADALRRELGIEIDDRIAALETRLSVKPSSLDESRLASLIGNLEARFSALEERLETRLSALLLSDAGLSPNDGAIDTLTHRLAEHRDSLGEAIAALTLRIDAVAGPHEDMAAIRREMSALKRALGERASGPSAPLIQLSDIVRNALPPDFFEMRAALANNRRVDCLVRLPHPPGPIAIDARFPVEAFHQLRIEEEKDPVRAENEFRRTALRHIVDVAERLIVPEETAESALLFIPSESMYAELHARFPDIVQDGYRARVWIVSPTTLMAALHTVRAVLRDAQARESADLIHAEAQHVLAEVEGLRRRVIALEDDFNRARHDVRDVISSTDQVYRRAETITNSRRALAESAYDRGSRRIPKSPDMPAPTLTPTTQEDDEVASGEARPFPLR